MAPVTTDRNYRQLLSTSLAYRTKEIQDLVFNSDPVSALLKEKGLFRTYSGPEIRVPLQIDKLDGQWFTGFDKLDSAPKEIINDAVFIPKNVAVGFQLTGTEMLANEGRTRIFNIIDRYMQTAENSMKDVWESALHGAGTGDSGREMVGFGGALPVLANTGTYGGINRATHAIWRSTTFDVPNGVAGETTFDSTTAQKLIRYATATRSKGARRATVAVADFDSFEKVQESMVAIQRITKEGSSTATAGWGGLAIATPVGTIEMFCATGVGNVMPANTIYGLDLEALSVYYHPDRNMVPLFPGEGAMPVNQDAIVQFLVWNGTMVLENPRYSWRMITA